jgi:hypothetical protein
VTSGGDQGPVTLEITFDESLTVETRLVFAVKRRLNPVLGGWIPGRRPGAARGPGGMGAVR